jgi:acyl-CoA synthetase (AMP-forming)/AMP-acid ligase II
MSRENVTDLFFAHAEKSPARCAIVNGKNRISYGELATQVKQTAAYFQSKGIGKGDRVLVFLPMGIDLYRTVLALFDIGATVVFLDEWVSRERLDVCCRLAKCKAWIGGWKVKILSFLSKELRKTPLKLGLGFPVDGNYSKIDTSADDIALITFTTGSTGIPKAAIRTHRHLQSQFDALIEKIQPEEGEIDMPVLPIVLLINLGAGCTSVIAPFKAKKAQKMKPEVMVELMLKEKVNRVVSSPYFAIRVAEYCAEREIELPELKKVFTGGAPVFPDEAAILSKGFPKTKVVVVYGSTEAEPISMIQAEDLKTEDPEQKNGLCVGQIHRNTELLILPISNEPIVVSSRKELQELALESGQIGEICVAGDHVLKFEGQCWHRTGDSGFVDGKNKLYLTGRAANLFEVNGKLQSPFLLEYYLKQFNEVNESTILNINGLFVLFVELKTSLFNLDLLKKKFPFVDEIVVGKIAKDPRHFSKIDYGRLKEDYLKNH